MTTTYTYTYPMYEHWDDLPGLLASKLIAKHSHPVLPLDIYNYTPESQTVPIADWTPAMCDCRGLILTHDGGVVGRPFRKFWNYDQMLAHIPAGEPFTVWEKLDGSLGIVCNYDGQCVIATRGSFTSEQAKFATTWFDTNFPYFVPIFGETFLFEILFPSNRIVVDYGQRAECVLLAMLDNITGDNCTWAFDWDESFTHARVFNGITDFSVVNTDPQFAGEEGFVIQYASGLRVKIKAVEYVRLHRLITQVSSKSIWDLLRTGTGIAELVDHVPAEFAKWVHVTALDLMTEFDTIRLHAEHVFENAPDEQATDDRNARKKFAAWAVTTDHPRLMFALLDNRPIDQLIWKMVEPDFSTPFRGESHV